jgi:excisionase family DNA binding protein
VREELRTFETRTGGDDKRDPPPNFDRTYLTVAQAAELAGLGPSTIRLYIRRRQLRAQKVGRRVLIKRSDLERFLEAHPIEAITG